MVFIITETKLIENKLQPLTIYALCIKVPGLKARMRNLQLISLSRNNQFSINKTDSTDVYKSETSLTLSSPLR
jgi:hypothetical protein